MKTTGTLKLSVFNLKLCRSKSLTQHALTSEYRDILHINIIVILPRKGKDIYSGSVAKCQDTFHWFMPFIHIPFYPIYSK